MFVPSKQQTNMKRSEYSREERCTVGMIFNAQKGGLDLLATLQVWHPDITKSLYQNNVFLVQLMQGGYSFAFGTIALLVAAGWVTLNHYAVVISAAALALLLTLLFAIASWQWDGEMAHSPSHNQAVHSAFLTWIGLQIVWFIFLGIWLHQKEFGSCCSTDAAQPNDDPSSVEGIQLMSSYALCCIFQFLSITFTIEAVYAHLYPEATFQLETVLNPLGTDTANDVSAGRGSYPEFPTDHHN